MEPEFWHERWRSNEIAFHQSEINPDLIRFAPRLQPRRGEAVLVPLCGKSRDMCWLAAQDLQVIGVEVDPIAVDTFFAEQGQVAIQRAAGPFTIFEHGPLTLFRGDFFAATTQQLPPLRLAYDRAALIALPAWMRPRYARQLGALLGSPARILLITLEYDQAQMSGPPFAVGAGEVRELFGARFDVELLDRAQVLEREPRFRDRGLTALAECAWLLAERA